MSLALQFPNLTVVDLYGTVYEASDALVGGRGRAGVVDIVHDTFGFLARSFNGMDRTHAVVSVCSRPCTRLIGIGFETFAVDFDISWTYANSAFQHCGERGICSMADRVMVLGPGHEQQFMMPMAYL